MCSVRYCMTMELATHTHTNTHKQSGIPTKRETECEKFRIDGIVKCVWKPKRIVLRRNAVCVMYRTKRLYHFGGASK